jgi:hypothetical protein
VAPVRASSFTLFTLPVILEVVICAYNRGLAVKAKASRKSNLLSINFGFQLQRKGISLY